MADLKINVHKILLASGNSGTQTPTSIAIDKNHKGTSANPVLFIDFKPREVDNG